MIRWYFVLLLLISFKAGAQEIPVSENRVVRYQIFEPDSSQNIKSTVLAFNGLIHPLASWQPMLERLREQGHRVLLFAYSSQPESFTHFENPLERLERAGELSRQDFALEAEAVLKQAGVKNRVNVLGLSYGAFIAKDFVELFPERVKTLTFMAPGTRPTQALSENLLIQSGQSYFEMGRYNPWIDFQYRSWLNSVVPQMLADSPMVPEGVNREAFIEGVLKQVTAVRYVDLPEEVKKLSKNIPVSVILAGKEEPKLLKDQIRLWEALPNKKELMVLPEAAHAIPASQPERSSQILNTILSRGGACQKAVMRALALKFF